MAGKVLEGTAIRKKSKKRDDGTGRQLPPLSSVLYGIISGRRSVLAA
jgi:hypothetical protein